MTLRVVIVDDEAIARRRVRRLLASMDDVDVVGEASGGEAAIDCIDVSRPHLVLLDVQMPEVDGFDVACRLSPPRPFIVFLTAHEQHALRAFEVHALDYLLKPVSRDRLAAAVARAVHWVGRDPAARDAQQAEAVAGARRQAGQAARRRWPVRSHGRVELVDLETVDWIEASGNYVVLHAGRRQHLLRETVRHMAAALDPTEFVRIHRSAIVRIGRIDRLETAQRGDYGVVLTDGTRLTLSRTHRRGLEKALGRRL
jgi:two-component system LytT family response regulator